MKQTANHLIALFGIASTVIMGWIAIAAGLETAQWGGSPPKSLQASYIGPTNPLEDLSNAEGHLSISVRSAGQEVSNLRVVQATLENNGQTPILPTDMFEPLSITADEPWQIINVANQDAFSSSNLKLKWKKLSDAHFQTDPLLINPGDRISATVYLTWKGAGKMPQAQVAPVKWQARISNLSGIAVEPDFLTQFTARSGPILVSLFGWGVPFTLISFLVYNALSVLLAALAGLVRMDAPWTLLLIPVAGLFNIAAAEAGATYVFGTSVLIDLPVSAAANLPPLLGNAAMIIALGVMAWRRRAAAR